MAKVVEPARYDAKAELAKRLANSERRGVDPVHYFRGKIVFGAYSRGLLEHIRVQTSTRVSPARPRLHGDGPRVRALAGSPRPRTPAARLLQLEPVERAAAEPLPGIRAALHRGDRPFDPRCAADPRLYASHHNVVGYDLDSSAQRCPPGSTPSLDMANLARRVREDLAAVVWPDEALRAEQYAILEAAEARVGVKPGPASVSTASLLRRAGDFVAKRLAPSRWSTRRRSMLPARPTGTTRRRPREGGHSRWRARLSALRGDRRQAEASR